jgi:hypothetical protein
MSASERSSAALVEAPPAVALPNAQLLNYLGNVTTPTRVRRVASISIGVVSIPAFLLAAVCLLRPLLTFIDLMTYGSAGGGWFPRPLSFGEAAILVLRGSIGWLMLMCFFSMIGLFLMILSRLVSRGNAGACRAAIIPLVPCAGLAFLGALYCGITCVVLAVPLWRVNRNLLVALLLFAGFWCCCVLILLVRDLITYLVWIARNPSTEKATVPFLPQMVGPPRV